LFLPLLTGYIFYSYSFWTILKDPSILIFDEAMSQVDADGESKKHKAIESLMHNRTAFVIAHRFSTIISADIIVVAVKCEIFAETTV
jgi:ABC-type multidrug transport system fused ATPase/permease subunit